MFITTINLQSIDVFKTALVCCDKSIFFRNWNEVFMIYHFILVLPGITGSAVRLYFLGVVGVWSYSL